MVNGLHRLYGISFIFFGVMVLIATPILRVTLSILYSIRRKDKLYMQSLL